MGLGIKVLDLGDVELELRACGICNMAEVEAWHAHASREPLRP
jgi:hypothetical protein